MDDRGPAGIRVESLVVVDEPCGLPSLSRGGWPITSIISAGLERLTASNTALDMAPDLGFGSGQWWEYCIMGASLMQRRCEDDGSKL